MAILWSVEAANPTTKRVGRPKCLNGEPKGKVLDSFYNVRRDTSQFGFGASVFHALVRIPKA
jgi:hypothetical protein